MPTLFEDDDADDGLDDSDIFGPKTTTATPSISNTKNSESPTSPSIAKKHPEPSIFDEIENEPGMDKISEANISKIEEAKQKPKSPTIDKKLPISSVLGLFDDDNDPDGGDLFGSKFVAKPSNVSKFQGVKEKPQQPKTMPTSSTATKTSLFGDLDDDDDGGKDLFSVPPPLPEPIKQSQPTKVNQKKIFSDDSSDDDLFGGGKTVVKKNPPKSSAGGSSSTSTIPKIAKNTKASEKLFSDSEDDDLFGGSKLKSTG